MRTAAQNRTLARIALMKRYPATPEFRALLERLIDEAADRGETWVDSPEPLSVAMKQELEDYGYRTDGTRIHWR